MEVFLLLRLLPLEPFVLDLSRKEDLEESDPYLG